MNLTALILAGGSGTRLWPISRKNYPKQFISIDNSGFSMFQRTVQRAKEIGCTNIIIACNEEHKFHVLNQLGNSLNSQIIIEPISKNTAPSIAVSSFLMANQANNISHNIIVMSADHWIEDHEKFRESVENACSLASKEKIVAIGVDPLEPNDGYGYIKKGDKNLNGYDVDKFVEKPSKKIAKKYIESKNYLWNCGIFVFKPKTFLNNLKIYSPDLYENCKKSFKSITKKYEFYKIDRSFYNKCENISIDYAVIEKSKNISVVQLKCKWSDLGSWKSLLEFHKKDADNNFSNIDSVTIDTKNTDIWSDNQIVASLGVQDLIISVTKDAVLVANKNSNNIKEISEALKEKGREEYKFHREVYRPWGKYDSIDNSANHQVKRITVYPRAKLSVQRHKHRSEHWVVIKGKARIQRGEDFFVLNANESTYIPAGTIHSLENPENNELLEIIEVQTGTYFGEDDIERFEDIYGREDE